MGGPRALNSIHILFYIFIIFQLLEQRKAKHEKEARKWADLESKRAELLEKLREVRFS